MTLNDLISTLCVFKDTYGEHTIVSFDTEYKDPKDDFRILINANDNVLYIGLKNE